jgi:hypothetical protein
MLKTFLAQVSLRNITILLLVLYPLDQLHTSIFEGSTLISPYKLMIGGYLFSVIKLNGINNTFASKDVLFLLFGMVALSALSILWVYSDYFLAIKYTLQLLVLWSFTVVAVKILGHDEKAIKSIIFYWLIVSAIVSYFSLSGVLSSSELVEGRRISFIGIGLNAMAISIGYSVVLGVAGFSLFKKQRIKQLLMIVAVLISLWTLVRLGTRSVIWGLLITFLIGSLINLSIKKAVFSVVALFAIVLVFDYFIENNYIVGRVLERILTFDSDVFQENSRVDLWIVGLEWVTNNVFGSGAGNEIFVYKTLDVTHSLEAHNVIVSAFIQFGVFGGGLFVLMLAILSMKFFKFRDRKFKLIFGAFLLFFLLQLFKGSFFQTRLFWQPITILLILINHQRYHISMKTTADK